MPGGGLYILSFSILISGLLVGSFCGRSTLAGNGVSILLLIAGFCVFSIAWRRSRQDAVQLRIGHVPWPPDTFILMAPWPEVAETMHRCVCTLVAISDTCEHKESVLSHAEELGKLLVEADRTALLSKVQRLTGREAGSGK